MNYTSSLKGIFLLLCVPVLFCSCSEKSGTTLENDGPAGSTAGVEPTDEDTVHTLTINITGQGLITIDNEACADNTCALEKENGETVSLMAMPELSTHFVGWPEPCAQTTECELELLEDTVLDVEFLNSGEVNDRTLLPFRSQGASTIMDGADEIYTAEINRVGTGLPVVFDGIKITHTTFDGTVIWTSAIKDYTNLLAEADTFPKYDIQMFSGEDGFLYVLFLLEVAEPLIGLKGKLIKFQKTNGDFVDDFSFETEGVYLRFIDLKVNSGGTIFLAGACDGVVNFENREVNQNDPYFLAIFSDAFGFISAIDTGVVLIESLATTDANTVWFSSETEPVNGKNGGKLVEINTDGSIVRQLPAPGAGEIVFDENSMFLVGRHYRAYELGGSPDLQGPSPGGRNLYAVRWDKPNYITDWVKTFGVTNDTFLNPTFAGISRDGNLYFAHQYGNAGLSFDGEGIPAFGGRDILVASLTNAGDVRFAHGYGSDIGNEYLRGLGIFDNEDFYVWGWLKHPIVGSTSFENVMLKINQ